MLTITDRTPDGQTEDVLAVESSLLAVPVSEYEEIYRKIAEADITAETDLPLYGVIRTHFSFLFAQNDHPPMAIPHLVILFELLDEYLEDHEYERIRCEELSENYQAVVTDVAKKHGIPVDGTGRFGFHRLLRGFVAGIVGYFLLVGAQVVALVWKLFHRGAESTKTVFVPHVNRFDSTKPVLDALDHDHEVVVPVPTVTWLRERADRYDIVQTYDPTPLDYFATPFTMIDSVRRGIKLTVEVLLRRSFDQDIQQFLNDEFDVVMPNTLWYLLGNLFAVHVRSLPNAVIAERMIDRLQPENLIIGSLGSRQQAILYPAIDAGLKTYHVPHSATTGYELAPPPETTHFVPGPHTVEHLESSEQMTETNNLRATGRPQLLSLSAREFHQRDSSAPEAIRIVVATQPFPDPHRREFITDVLDGIAEVPGPVDTVIKIHPNESTAFYSDIVQDRNYPIRVAEADLHEYLTGADLVVTINSNVGLESMVLGTPAVCVDEWSPLIRARLYATSGPVPILRSPSEVSEFFAGLSSDRIEEMTAEQTAFVEEMYLHEDAAREIARTVREDE
jgi:hypothetical protein